MRLSDIPSGGGLLDRNNNNNNLPRNSSSLRLLRIFWLLLLLNFEPKTVQSLSTPAPSSSISQQQQQQLQMVQDLPLDALASTASSFASVHGILVERRQTDMLDADSNTKRQTSYFECAPISLLPNAFPKAALEQAKDVAPLFNQLVDTVSQDAEFLETTLAQVVQADPFTAQLLELYRDLYVNNVDNSNSDEPNFAPKADRLGLFRSDYMLHTNNQIKQVELNTIASSFGALSTRVAALHRHLTTTLSSSDTAVQDFLTTNKRAVLGSDNDNKECELLDTDGVPVNPALERLAQALHGAAQRYCETHCNNVSNKPVILFVVQPGETNTVDQRLLEFEITQAHGWRVVRKSLTELSTEATVDPTTGALRLGTNDNDDDEVAVVYYRAGYAPTDYFGPNEWKARRLLERSVATKSPCLGHHLVGTKKVQQALARPGALERFVSDSKSVEQLRAVFAGLYSLGTDFVDEDKATLKAILKDGKEGEYVLKPQREGGGYNFYGEQMADRLRPHVEFNDDKDEVTVNHSILSEYILMERLFPPEQRAILLRSGQVEGSGPSISELGCFGTILCGPDGNVFHNTYAGFLMRTKFSHVDEGGVAAGFATLSSPYLVE